MSRTKSRSVSPPLTARDRQLLEALGNHKDFNSLHSAWAKIPATLEKGGPFEDLVKHYLYLDPRYASRLKRVWLTSEVPTKVVAKLGLPPGDAGIDLIAETKEGDYWAVQAKFRSDTSRSLTWKADLSTFVGLAFGACRSIKFGLICATSERLPKILRKETRLGFLARDTWFSLGEEFFERLRARLMRRQKPLVKFVPKPHQAAAINDIKRHFAGKSQRGKLIMPCGTGKSLTAYWVSKKLGAKRVIVAVPSLFLLNQTLAVWLRESMADRDQVDWLCVCSDETAGRLADEDASFFKQDLAVDCLTKPSEIARELSKHTADRLTVFTTYQSARHLAAAARQLSLSFDLAVFDEAHKTAGKKNGLFASLLSDSQIHIRQRLFMTATERRYRGQRNEIISMEDSSVYGSTAHLLSFQKAMEASPPVLCDYKIITLYVSKQEVANLIRRNKFIRARAKGLRKETEAQTLASLVALRTAFRDLPMKHAVSFHSRKYRAKQFADLNDAFTKAVAGYPSLKTFHVTGDLPTATRAKTIQEFVVSNRALITNARCLTEGVDIPSIDAVLFADPRRSSVDVVQAVGRALRPAKGKKLAYVIVPVLFDHTRPLEETFESSAFKEILATLRALACNDERIVEEFRRIAEAGPSGGDGVVDVRISEKLARWIDATAFANAIQLRYWDRTAALAWRPFAAAREFVHSLKLESQTAWFNYTRGAYPELGTRPPDIPSLPPMSYSSEWINWGDWLGTGTIASQDMRYKPFREARAFVRNLRLASRAEWERYVAGKIPNKDPLPTDIPSNPRNTYGNKGWNGWGDWLGTGRIANQRRQWRRFNAARKFARSLGLSSQAEWFQYVQSGRMGCPERPADIPTKPYSSYAGEGWLNWSDWLGTDNIGNKERKKQFWPFIKARAFVRRLKLKSSTEWRAYAAGKMPQHGLRPLHLPSNPNAVYAESGWIDMADWLGKEPYRPRK